MVLSVFNTWKTLLVHRINRYIGDYHVGLPHLSYFRNDYCRTQDD